MAQGSGSVLATAEVGLVRPRPGLHPGDLSLRPDQDAVAQEQQRMAGRRPLQGASSSSATPC